MNSATSRRSFLCAGAVAAAARALFGRDFARSASAAETLRRRIRLGVASYSLRNFDRAHVVGCMKQLNTRWLNAKDKLDHLPMSPPAATDEALAAYKAAGIELTAAGVIDFPTSDDDDIRGKFEYARRAGVSLIVASPAREALPALESFVRQYDMRLAIHNHGPGDKWPSPLDVLKVVEPMDRRIGVCVDVGHTARTGTDVVQAILQCGSRVFDVHMKDLADMAAKESQVAVGDGKMPVRGIFEALHTIGYQGYVDLEYEIHEDDPMPGMVKSFAYMRGVLSGMKYGD